MGFPEPIPSPRAAIAYGGSSAIPAKQTDGDYAPDRSKMPIIKAESIFNNSSGVSFYLPDDLNFAEVDTAGDLVGKFELNTVSGGVPIDFLVTRRALVVSSFRVFFRRQPNIC